MFPPEQLVLLTLTGFIAGAVNAVAGGGSLVVFPTLLGIGLSPFAANVTNAVAQWPGYVSMVVGVRRDLSGQGKRIAVTTTAVGAGAIIGCILLLTLPGTVFDVVVPILLILASMLMAVGPAIRRRMLASVHGGDRLRIATVALFLAGIYGGYFGGALGVILIAALSVFIRDSLFRLNALKGVLSVGAATVTVIIFSIFATVQWPVVAVIAPASILGGFIGGRLARRLPEPVLRWCVVTLGLTVGIFLAVT